MNSDSDQCEQDGRFERLEISLAHQQRLCEQLNEVVTQQADQIAQLEKLVPKLQVEIRELQQSLRSERFSVDDEKPPHY